MSDTDKAIDKCRICGARVCGMHPLCKTCSSDGGESCRAGWSGGELTKVAPKGYTSVQCKCNPGKLPLK